MNQDIGYQNRGKEDGKKIFLDICKNNPHLLSNVDNLDFLAASKKLKSYPEELL